jgi:hypothetical protein
MPLSCIWPAQKALWMAGVVNLSRQKQAFWSFFWIHFLGSAPKK